MKKMLLVLLTLGVIFSCGAKEEAKPEETKTNETTQPAKDGEAAAEEVKFKDADVQKFVDDYKVLIKDYTTALESKDATKIQDLTTKSQEVATKMQEITTTLANDPEEAKKFGEVMTKLGEEFANAATNAVK